jgi:hypothetical protein
VQRQVDEALEGGIDLEQLDALQGQLEGMDAANSDRGALLNKAKDELEASRRVAELEQQQDALRQLLAKSREWLAFAHDRFRQALNCSLELLGVSGLEAHTDERGQPCWRLANPEDLPAQTRDKSWENTLDSLRGVKPVKAYLSDWRRDNPVRPVIFSDPGRLSAEAVHLHLEHRLAQRLLSRFLSQGFLHHELSRACVLPSRDPQPRVVVLGRLSLFGQGAARLHDELITVMADWHPGDDRSTALKPQLQAGKEATWGMLQEALQIAESGGLPAVDTARFQAMAEQDVMALLPLLKQQSEAALEAAAALLKQRGSTEAQALKEVLRDQRKRINATLRQRTRELAKLDRQAADAEPTALIPGLEEQINVPALDLAKLSSQERKQLSADQRHWARRLETIEAELSSEPQRIVDSYRVVTHRLEPAGLVYLWPISG